MMKTDFVVAENAKADLQREVPSFRDLPTRAGTGKKPLVVFTNDAGFDAALNLAELAKSRSRPVLVALLESQTDAMSILARHHIDSYPLPDVATALRIMQARAGGGAEQLIASASVVGDRLLVWSCEPRAFECSFSDLPALSRLPEKDRRRFEIDADGSFLRWPDHDIDLDLSAVRYAADPKFRKTTDQNKRRTFKRYGDAIRKLREARGLRQSDIAGVDARQMRRLENGAHVPHPRTIARLAEAHGMTPDAYLAALTAK
jgi:hypothetical protein